MEQKQAEAEAEQKSHNEHKKALEAKKVQNDTVATQADAKRKQDQSVLDAKKLDQDMEIHEDDIVLRATELELEATLEAQQERGVELG